MSRGLLSWNGSISQNSHVSITKVGVCAAKMSVNSYQNIHGCKGRIADLEKSPTAVLGIIKAPGSICESVCLFLLLLLPSFLWTVYFVDISPFRYLNQQAMTLLHNDYSSRSPFAEPTTLEKLSQRLPAIFRWGADRIRTRVAFFGNIPSLITRRSNGRPGAVKTVLQTLFTVRTALALLWGLTLWWGERTVFKESLEACNWSNWEKWVSSRFDVHAVRVCAG